MLTELKSEIQKTFNRKIENRGACEALVQDIYEKTGAVISYNTVRRLYGLAEYRKPRESTLDHLAVYCGFRSFKVSPNAILKLTYGQLGKIFTSRYPKWRSKN